MIDKMETLWESMTEVKEVTDKPMSLHKMQEYVGGLIEIVYLNDGSQLVVNEEGLIKNLTPNPKATRIAREEGNWTWDLYLHGNALLLRGNAKVT